jgi:hypothetical protein
MATPVPDRGDNPKRRVCFYDEKSGKSHTADVRWVGGKWNQKPHAGDIKKNMKNYGQTNSGWEVAG